MAAKLYQLSYISDSIEQFARNMLLAAVDQHVSDIELSQSGFSKQRVEGEVYIIYSLDTFLLIIFFFLHELIPLGMLC